MKQLYNAVSVYYHLVFVVTLTLGLSLYSTPIVHAQTAELTLVNEDGIPFPDRLVFNRIGSLAEPPIAAVHDTVTVNIENTGTEAFQVTALDVTGPFALLNAPTLPVTVGSGESLSLDVRFTAETGTVGPNRGIHTGELLIDTNVDDIDSVVELAGYWQNQQESGVEPELPQIIERAYGYGTDIVGPGQELDSDGRIAAVGDEVLSDYWEAADGSQAVTVHALASFYECCENTKTLSWYLPETPTVFDDIMVTRAIDGQSFMPRLEGGSDGPATGSFSPAAEQRFGFVVNGVSFSDPMLNDVSSDDCSGGRETCGHRVRFWPALDRAGEDIPDTYIMVADVGVHYDFNDGVYLISNITPSPSNVAAESDEQPVAYALDNYPNPFNPRTTIGFDLPKSGEVRLEVFDGLGRAVAVLVDGHLTAGRHEIDYDAQHLTSGLYIARLTSGSVTKSHVLMLIK